MAWGDPFATTTPNYVAVNHPKTVNAAWGSITGPYPTDRWFNNLVLDTTNLRIATHPYQIQAQSTGLYVCYPAYSVGSTSIVSGFLKNMTLEATETIVSKTVLSHDYASVMQQWKVDASHYMKSPIVKGMPYLTMIYNALTPVLKSQHAMTSVNGSSTPGAVTSTKFKVVLNNGQTWLIYASSSLTLTWSNTGGWRMLASSTYTGTLRMALLDNAAKEADFDTYSTCYPISCSVDVAFSGDTATMTYTWGTVGTGSLLMLALPHHMDMFSSPPTQSTVTLTSLKGKCQGVVGSTWVLLESLTTIQWDAPNAPDVGHVSAIITQLNTESLSAPAASDPYFFGKELARLARLAVMADYFSQTTLATTIRTNMKTYIQPWLNHSNSDALKYDQTYGGICSTNGLADQNADFGNGYYNDHHFHYGYFAYSAAAIAKGDPTWAAANNGKVLDLIREYANPSTTDPYFSQFRHKDFFDFHSWANGIHESGDGNNQESSSEAINGYYGVYLWGLAVSDNYIRDVGRLLLAMEIRAAIKYYHIKSTDTIYPAPFNSNAIVGINWETKVDYGTFFSGLIECIHGIQMLPFTPVTELSLTSDWVTQEYPIVAVALSRPSPVIGQDWKGFVICDQAVIDKTNAWTNALTLSGFDDGNSLTNILYWISTRPSSTPPPPILDPALWLRADVGVYNDAGSTPATNGQTVQQWNDQSGGGANASQATSGNRPKLITNVVNSLPVVRFDGQTNFMDIATFNSGPNITVFVVAINQRSIDNNNNFSGYLRSGIGVVDTVLATNFSGNQAGKFGMNLSTFNYFGDQKLKKIYFDQGGPGSTVFAYKNGLTSPVTLDYAEPAILTYLGQGVQTNTTMRLAMYTDSLLPGQNDIAEILVYQRILSPDEIAVVTGTLSAKYNIPSYAQINGTSTVPNYQFVKHMSAPLPVLSQFSAPLPTNPWFGNAIFGQYTYPDGSHTSDSFKQLPYSMRCYPARLEVCVPARTVTATQISETYSGNMVFNATETIVSQFITAYDKLSVTMKWQVDSSHYMSAPIVRGSPYVTMNYTALTPKLTTDSNISTINGSASSPVTGTKFKVVLVSGQTWLIYASSSITLTWSGKTMTAGGTLTGSIRVAYMPTSGDESILDTYKTCIPISGAVAFIGTGQYTFTFTTTGSGSLLMMALPHHVDILESPTTVSTQYQVIDGLMTGIVGTTWTLQEVLPTVTWTAPRPIDPRRLAAIITAVGQEYTYTPDPPGTFSDGDVYFYGKEFCKMARLALIADEVGETSKRDVILTNLKTAINLWLLSQNSNKLRYDYVWGGIITSRGARYPFDDFTQGWFSDHVIHYGYFCYAAAVISKYDTTWMNTYKNYIEDLRRDFMNYNSGDAYYTPYRHKDFFQGNSWFAGMFDFGAGRNEESTSEAINGYYGAYLWGLVIGDTTLQDQSQMLMAMEIRSAIKYWHVKAADTQYPAPFNAKGVVGILWSMQADYTVFFETGPQGTHTEWIFGIQMLPFTPLAENYLDSAWVTEALPKVQPALTRTATAHAIVAGGSISAVAVDDGGTFATTKGYTGSPQVTISAPPAVVCGNEVLNPSFEDTSVWSTGGSGGSVTISSPDFSLYGTKSLKQIQTGATATLFAFQDIPVVPGQVIQFSAYIKVTAFSAGGLGLFIKSTNYGVTYAQSTQITGIVDWTRVSGSFTVPSGVTVVRLILDGLPGGATNNYTAYWDGMMFEPSNSLNAYCPVPAIPNVQARLTGNANSSQGGALSIGVQNPGSGYINSACGNILKDPSAELGTGWTAGGTTANVTIGSTDFSFDGTKSIKVVEVAGNCFAYQDVSVSPGQLIQFSAYAKITAFTSGGMYISVKTTNFGFTYATSTSLTGVNNWTRLSGSFTVPAGVTVVRFILDGLTSPTLTGYWDAMMMEVSNSLNPFCIWTPSMNDPVVTVAPAIEEGWKGFIYMFQAVIDADTAWTNAQTLQGYDNGNSKTNTLYWIATRSYTLPNPYPVILNEAGQSVDAESVIGKVNVSDAGTGSDSMLILVGFEVDDFSSGTEYITIGSLTFAISVVDTGNGADVVAIIKNTLFPNRRPTIISSRDNRDILN